ncbi:Glycosyltransferase involved in cell wall bisynthesis [Microbacterium sp. ru370.1]|uniref:glycosyltransferase n=1 Tax=unclassified Microbacterium TaxID=2609290 RepID=UPI00088E3710|nr:MULTISPECIES: glycosyltransferase [unclassified Microbacterium]SDO30886.1 Glycosyltransferase involved in cell wall bisynthesis [Microbacterium sp. ru370.1]SIT76192.1 Glycosyltransferase involved in cell wall bisynthesis [Microbacterium sp. RU1D]
MTTPATPADNPAPAAESSGSSASADRPLKILIGADTFLPHVNGAARFAERLAAGLVARGHDVHVAAPSVGHRNAGTAIETIEGQPMMMHRLPAFRFLPHDWITYVLPWRSKHYARIVLDEVKPDVVHIQSHIVIGRGLAREARKRGIPVVATNHVMAENILDFTTLPDWLDRIFVKLAWADAERTFKMTRAVTTPTRKAADFLESTIDIDGVIPISCGIDRSNYRPDLTPRDANRILFVGRLTTEKHIDVVLAALAKLDPALDVTFDIVGGGDQRAKLEALAEQLGVAKRVTFHGHASDDDLRDLYSRASVFAIASIAELQSIATMEAMASGLPIVAANAVALPHLVHEGENGYLFTPGDADELAARLTDVLTASPDERRRMQQASLDEVAVHDITRTLDTFEALYRGRPLPE